MSDLGRKFVNSREDIMTDQTQIDKARHLLRDARSGSLGVIRPSGGPYVSLVMVAMDQDLQPLLLLSDLAEHSKCLKEDGRASLLIDGSQDANGQSQLTGARLSLTGMVERLEQPEDIAVARSIYLDKHQDAAGFVDFADFHFYRFRTEKLHLVAGFGKIDWLDAADLA